LARAARRSGWVGGHPAGELLAGVGVFLEGERGSVQQGWFDVGFGAGVEDFDFAVDVLRAPVHVGGVIEDDGAGFEEAAEEGGHAPELVLAPVFVGVVVALGAIEAAAEEDADLFRHDVGRGADLVVGDEVAGGGAVTFGGEAFAGDFVVGAIGGDVIADPLPVFLAELGGEAVGEDGDAEDVGEAERPVIGEFRGGDEGVDEFLAFLGVAEGQEFADAFGGREGAGEVETDAAEELGVGGDVGGEDVDFAELGEDGVVDEIGAGDGGVVGDGGADDADGGAGEEPGGADEDGGFAEAFAFDDAIGGDGSDFAVIGTEEDLIGVVFGVAVGELGGDQEALGAGDGERGHGGIDFEAGEGGCGAFGAIGRAGFYPVEDGAVVFGILLQFLAAAVGDLH
jgi:hypothetical protein